MSNVSKRRRKFNEIMLSGHTKSLWSFCSKTVWARLGLSQNMDSKRTSSGQVTEFPIDLKKDKKNKHLQITKSADWVQHITNIQGQKSWEKNTFCFSCEIQRVAAFICGVSYARLAWPCFRVLFSLLWATNFLSSFYLFIFP